MIIPPPLELNDFPIVIEIPVQWGEQDAFGHVNNVVFFRWFESARIAYLEAVRLGDRTASGGLGPILAAIDCNYRRQVKYPDTVRVGARATRIGRSSIGIEHKLWSQTQQAFAADAKSTVVVFDYQANQSHPVPDWLRTALQALEGKDLGSGS